jgi:hypothetical protein
MTTRADEAICGFCSREENSVQVICEGRCLICNRCQHLSSIRKLLYDVLKNTNQQISEDTDAHKPECPLCSHPLAPNMMQIIKTFYVRTHPTGRLFGEMDLSYSSNILHGFLKKFYQTYGEGKASNTTSDYDNVDIVQINNGKQKQDKIVLKKDTGPKLRAEFFGMFPPARPEQVVEFSSDCYCHQWAALLRNSNESISSMAMKLCSRKKASQRSNDTKIFGMLDFFTPKKINPVDTPYFYLFGKLLGIYPHKVEMVRPTSGQISTVIFVLVYCEKCLQNGFIYDVSNDYPNVLELRQRMGSTPGRRLVSIRKAIKIIQLMVDLVEPRWMMSNALSACMEFNAPLPWRSNALSKLYHLLFYMAGITDFYHNSELTKSSGRKTTCLAPPNSRPSSPAVIEKQANKYNDIDPAMLRIKELKSKAKTIWGSRIVSPRTPSKSNTLANLQFLAKMNNSNTPSFSSPAAPPTGINTNSYSTFDTEGQSIPQSSIPSNSGKASKSGNLQKAVSMANEIDIGQVINGTVTAINIEKALAIGNVFHITSADLALICCEAWELEREVLENSLKRALVVKERRVAVFGKFGGNISNANNKEKLAISRIIDWFIGNGKAGVDWTEAKEIAVNSGYHFHVPPSILQKSNTELDYYARNIIAERTERREVETLEDIFTSDIKYSKSVVQNAMGAEVLLELQKGGLTLEEKGDLLRRQYLMSQTLGGGGSSVSENSEGSTNNLIENIEYKFGYLGLTKNPTAVSLPLSLNASQIATMSSSSSRPSSGKDKPYIPTMRPSSGTLPPLNRPDTGDSDVWVNPNDDTFDLDNTDQDKDLRPDLLSYLRLQLNSQDMVFTSSNSRPTSALSDGNNDDQFVIEAAALLDKVDKLPVIDDDRPMSPSPENLNPPLLDSTVRDKKVSLTGQPYKSPKPAKYSLSMVDILDTESPAILSKVKLINDSRIPPKNNILSSSAPSLSLEEDLFGFMDGPNPQPFGFNSSHSTSRILSKEACAKSRINSRLNKAIATEEEVRLKELAKYSSKLIGQNSELMSSDNGGIGNYLNLKKVMDDDGFDLLDTPETMKSTKLCTEALILKNSNVNTKTFQNIMLKYLTTNHLKKLRKLDISNNSLGLDGAHILHNKLNNSSICTIVHLNLRGNNFGDTGCGIILKSMIRYLLDFLLIMFIFCQLINLF